MYTNIFTPNSISKCHFYVLLIQVLLVELYTQPKNWTTIESIL